MLVEIEIFSIFCAEKLKKPREGVIIDWPLNGQFHDRHEVILTSQLAIINLTLTVAKT